MRKNRIVVAAAAVLVVLMPVVAGACPQARVALSGRDSGPVGSTVGVDGTNWGTGVVEIRWNSKGGQKLGEAMGPNFSLNVVIPDAPTGVHYLVASSAVGVGQGENASSAAAAFEVTEAQESITPASDRSQIPGHTSANTNGTEDEALNETGKTQRSNDLDVQGSSDAEVSNTATAPADGDRQSADRSSPAPAALQEGTGAAAPHPGTGAAAPAKVSSGSANPPALVTPSGQVLFGGSHAEAVSLDAGGVLTGAAGTVSGDTWTGISSATKPSLLLDGQLAPATGPSPAGPAPAAGIVLVGSGLIAMLGGFTVAEVRRKAALAKAAAR